MPGTKQSPTEKQILYARSLMTKGGYSNQAECIRAVARSKEETLNKTIVAKAWKRGVRRIEDLSVEECRALIGFLLSARDYKTTPLGNASLQLEK